MDRHVEHWSGELPDLDPRIEGIVTRMQAVVRHLRRRREAVLAEHDLQGWEHMLLQEIRASGEPYQATPTALAAATGVVPTTLTSRLDRLEARGFVTRPHDPADRRRLLVELTPAGHAAWENAMSGLDVGEKELLAELSPAEQDRLDALLRPLMRHVDAGVRSGA